MNIQAPLITRITDRSHYRTLIAGLETLSAEDRAAYLRILFTNDLFFLLVYGLRRKDADNDWCFDRCREVQQEPDGHLDLWAREHYKSTIITFALTIQDVLNDPEKTFCILSFNRPTAKKFLRQIKYEFETNEILKELFPDVLWADPQKEAPKWSEDEGIVVRRKGNPKEQTVEAYGLVDSMPTGGHYDTLLYDDVVVPESVTGPDMIGKVTERWELSDNLGSRGGVKRHIGTRYHFNDTYGEMIRRQVVKPRIYPATEDGTVEGSPVYMTREQLDEKRRIQGPYTYACQMLQNPVADQVQGFNAQWLRHYDTVGKAEGMVKTILVDPASEKKKGSDYTAIWVVGHGADGNRYALDFIRDRLNLSERAAAVMRLHRKWKPVKVGYEKYGLQADIEHIRHIQNEQNYRFEVIELGGSMPKNDRIRRLIPDMEQGRWWFPITHHYTDYEKITRDLKQVFVEEELKPFPVGAHDDMLDALSRDYDDAMQIAWPMGHDEKKDAYDDTRESYGDPWAA